MSGLRAHWTVGAAGVMLAGAVFSLSGGSTRAAQVIDIPVSQQTAPAEERPAVEPSPITPLLADELAAEPRVEVAQFPPPPFYSGPTYTSPSPSYQQRWRWPWESDTPAQPRSSREMRQQEIRPPNELGQTARKRHWRERNGEGVAERQPREPSFALTRHMRGSYKDKISALLDQPQSFPQPKGPLLLVVSIQKQTVTVYDGGVQFAKSPVSSGTPERPTPLGVFSILEKQWWHRSNLYSAAPMPFMQRITWDGVALHAGELPGYRASHGCVRLPESFAYRLWYTSGVGARVVIAWNDLVPAEVTHPLLFQPTPPPALVPGPAPTPAPVKPPQISPREDDNAPVSVMYRPVPDDELELMRDRMITGTMEDRDNDVVEASAEEDEQSPLQSAMAFTRLDGSDLLDAQPVLDMLSARSKTKRHHFARVSVPEYEPESVLRPGPLSVFVSRKDSRIYVRKGMQPMFDMPVTVAQPSENIGTHVFEAVSAGSDGKLRWMAVSPTGNEGAEEHYSRYRRRAVVDDAPTAASPTRAAIAALDRIGLPQAAMDRIDDLVSVGSTLIVSDQGLGRTAAIPDTDFSVVLR